MSDRIEVGFYRFDSYEIVGDSNNWGWHSKNAYIRGSDSTHIAIEPTEYQTLENRDVLDSLIHLSQLVLDPQKRKDALLKWVSQYGLPFIDDELSQLHTCFACPLGPFMDFLFGLRDSLQKLNAINESDMDILGEKKNNANPYTCHNISWPNDKIERIFCEWLNNSYVLIRTRFQNHEPQIYLYAPSLLDAAKYQMALVLLTNSGSVPKRCICCNSYFFANRANQKYCSFCSPQKNYAKKKRTKKEGQINNG